MLNPSGNIGAAQLCPYLGLASDPSTACLFVSDFHRCFRRAMPETVTEGQQAAYCISSSHANCPRFAIEEPGVASDAGVQTSRARSGWIGRGPFLVIAATICLLAIAAFAISSVLMGANQTSGTGTSITSPSEPLLAVGVLPATALPPTVAGSTPTTPPTPAAQSIPVQGSAPARPTGTPVASSNQKSYVVVAGDTLWGIAQKNGVSVEALMRANSLTDRSYVRSGQRLVIPER